MVLSGWSPAPTDKDEKKYNGNGGSTSNALPAEADEAPMVVEVQEVSKDTNRGPAKKRKLAEDNEPNPGSLSSVANETRSTKKVEKLDIEDDEDDLVMIDNWTSVPNKKTRLQ